MNATNNGHCQHTCRNYTAVPRSRLLIAAAGLLAVLVGGCDLLTDTQQLVMITSDTFDNGLLQVAAVDGATGDLASFISVDEGGAGKILMSWPIGVGLDGNGEPCLGRGEALQWIDGADGGRFFTSLRVGCEQGPYWINRDGEAERIDLAAGARPETVVTFSPFGHQMSADGQSVAFVVPTVDVDDQPYEDLFVTNLNDGAVRRATSLPPGLIPAFAWLPEADTLIIAHRPHDGRPIRLYRVGASMSSIAPIIDPQAVPGFASEPDSFSGPMAASADGQWLALVAAGIPWLVDLGDGFVREIGLPEPVGTRAGVTVLAWAPDEPLLAFDSDHEGACRGDDPDEHALSPPFSFDEHPWIECEAMLYTYSVEADHIAPLTWMPQSPALGLTWAPCRPTIVAP